MSARQIVLTGAFAFFLYPITIGDLSVNYSFLLLPFVLLVKDGKFTRPHPLFFLLMGWYTFVFAVASLYQYEFHGEALRRMTSALLFMSMFAYTLVRIDDEMIASFKAALVLVATVLSLSSILGFFAWGGTDVYIAKDVVGSQRIGFIYLLALWLVYLKQEASVAYVVVKYVLVTILLGGLLMTFSRSSIAGLLASVGLFFLAGAWAWIRRPNAKTLLYGLVAICVGGMAVVGLHTMFPAAFEFFDLSIWTYLLDRDAVMSDFGDPDSTGGKRLFLLGETIYFATLHPLTGSGYLGIWVLVGDFAGSAHNQYADVLFRTGFIGFFAYVYVLVALTKYLYDKERALFWGFVGVLCYGLFHETFKESQGGFVLAFLLGLLSQSMKANGKSRTVPAALPTRLANR